MKILLTAIYSDELAEVTAMKIKSKVAAAPPFPRRATAASGNTKPAVTSALAILWGKDGKMGFDSRARAERPMVVAASQGMANQLRPPMMYPGRASTGLAAMALL